MATPLTRSRPHARHDALFERAKRRLAQPGFSSQLIVRSVALALIGKRTPNCGLNSAKFMHLDAH